MSYITKSWVKTQFDNFASRISAVFAKKEEVEALKKTVSDGKELVADAITEKGVETAADATFATMAENIGQIEMGNNAIIGESPVLGPYLTKDPNYIHNINASDYGLDGFSTINFKPTVFEDLVIKPSEEYQYRSPSSGADVFGNIKVEPILTQTKTVDPSVLAQTVTPDAGKDGLSQVTVNAAPLQAKTVSPSSVTQIVKPDGGQYGLSQVAVSGIKYQNKTVTPAVIAQHILPDEQNGIQALYEVVVNAAPLQSKTVTPAGSIQTVYPDAGFYGLSAVSVAAAEMINLTNKSWNTYAKNTSFTLYGNQKALILSSSNLEQNLVISTSSTYNIKHFGDVIPGATSGGYAIRACYIAGNGYANTTYLIYNTSRPIHVLILN